MAVEKILFFSSRRRHTRCLSDWSSDVCSSDLGCCGLIVLVGAYFVWGLHDFASGVGMCRNQLPIGVRIVGLTSCFVVDHLIRGFAFHHRAAAARSRRGVCWSFLSSVLIGKKDRLGRAVDLG